MIGCRLSIYVRVYSKVMSTLFEAGEMGKALQLQLQLKYIDFN
jgi:hypothetical protein